MNKEEILKNFPIKEKILFMVKTGSFLYGTNSEKSDTDIKAIFLPDLEDLILRRAPNHYSFSTGNNKSKNEKEDIDFTAYSLQYFLELAAKGETNALDLLFSFTNPEAIIFKDETWDKVISGIDKIVTKNVNSYLGFCRSQAIKYSIKGEKLHNFKQFNFFCEKHLEEKNKLGETITLKDALIKYILLEDEKLPLPGEDKKSFSDCLRSNSPRDMDGNHFFTCQTAFSFFPPLDFFGKHAYFFTEENKEQFLQISGIKFPLQDTIKKSSQKVLHTICSYGSRAERAASDNGADYKALSHAVRVVFQTEELLTTGIITFPLKKSCFIKQIKYQETDAKLEDIVSFIDEKIAYIEKEAIPNTKLRDKSDFKWIENIILSCYKRGE